MDNDHYTIERCGTKFFRNLVVFFSQRLKLSAWWAILYILFSPFMFFFLLLLTIPFSIRLAVHNADSVVFVLASSFLSFYQIPRTAFYVYISVIGFTGFLQFLRYESDIGIDFYCFCL